jgi:hypothetical protein
MIKMAPADWNRQNNIFFNVANAFISKINTQTTHIMSISHNSIAMFSLQNLAPWRDLNPGLLVLKRIRYPLCHDARVATNQRFCLHFLYSFGIFFSSVGIIYHKNLATLESSKARTRE